MKEIRDEVYDKLEQDAIIQVLTGWTVADTRIYLEWPPEVVGVSAAKPAYIIFELQAPAAIDMSGYTQPVQLSDHVAEINVFANTATLRDQIAERIMAIFWFRDDTEFATASYRIMHVVQEAADNIPEIHEGTGQIKYWRKYIRLRFEYIYLLT